MDTSNIPAEKELQDSLPFIEVKIVEHEDFGFLIEQVFATDRREISKGMIEIVF